MRRVTFAGLAYENKKKKTRRERFLDEMAEVIPWDELAQVIIKHYPKAGNGRQPMPLEWTTASISCRVVWAIRSGDGGCLIRYRIDAAVCGY